MKRGEKGQPRHGMRRTSTYQCWADMKSRCLNPEHKVFSYYGGRGIAVCDKWLHFMGFYEDMGDKPEGLTLDRINNDKGYSKENCKWSTRKEQLLNRRTRKISNKDIEDIRIMLSHNLPQKEIAAMYNVAATGISKIKRGLRC